MNQWKADSWISTSRRYGSKEKEKRGKGVLKMEVLEAEDSG